MALISASNLPRIALCAPSAFLPKDPYRPSKNALKGTNVHKFVSDCVMFGEQEARTLIPNRMNGKSLIDRIDVQSVLSDLLEVQTEIAVRWDAVADDCSILGVNIGRNYYGSGARDWDIVGSIDLVGRNPETGRLVIADVKTGIQEIQAVASEQLQALAYISSRVFNCAGEVETRIIKIRDDGSVHTNYHVVTASELGILKLKFQGVREKVLHNLERYQNKLSLELFEGDHCTWCPSKGSCPAKLCPSVEPVAELK